MYFPEPLPLILFCFSFSLGTSKFCYFCLPLVVYIPCLSLRLEFLKNVLISYYSRLEWALFLQVCLD